MTKIVPTEVSCNFVCLPFQFFFKLKLNRINPLSANFTKWLNTLKQFVGNLPTNCLSVFDYFVGFALKGLNLPISVPVVNRN